MKLRNYGITKPLWSLTRQRSIITMVVLLAGIVGSTLGLTDNVQAAVGADYTTAQVKSTLNVIGKPSLFVRDIVLDHYEQYDQSQAFVSGYDSRGKRISFQDINIIGTVLPDITGTYFQIFKFTDPYTHETIIKSVKVSVSNKEKVVKPVLLTRNITINQDDDYDPRLVLAGGHDSRGHALTFDQLDFEGTVSVSNRGTYIQIFSFTDPYTQERVSQTVFITVK